MRRTEHVDERRAGILHRRQNSLQSALARVFDDDARLRRHVGFDVGIDAPGIPDYAVQSDVLQPSRERPCVD